MAKGKRFFFGMKQRLSLAMCLVDEPEIAIMDEPFVGLDQTVLIRSFTR